MPVICLLKTNVIMYLYCKKVCYILFQPLTLLSLLINNRSVNANLSAYDSVFSGKV